MENKHNSWDLPQMQSLPLSAKIRMTEQRIIDWYEAFYGDVYVSVSGGKDSQVLAHIVKRLYPDVPCVFVNTGLEYDSVRVKGQELADETLRPDMNFFEVITKYGYPVISKEVSDCVAGAKRYIESGGRKGSIDRLNKLRGTRLKKDGTLSQYNYKKYEYLLDAPFRISPACCNVMKKNPSKAYEKRTGSQPFIGTLASESRLRRQKWEKYGCNAFEKNRPTSQPLSFWTEQDILEYIQLYNIAIAEAYGNIICNDKKMLTTTKEKRTGCVFCLFGITRDPERLLRVKEMEPKKYDFIMSGGKFDKQGMWVPDYGLGYKFVVDWLNEHGGLDIKY